jgi:hypothetical protein
VFAEENVSVNAKSVSFTMAASPAFPLTLAQMLPVAEALTRTGAQFRNFQRFFESKFPADFGFPVRFSLPVFPTVSASITFDRCELVTPPAELFLVPDDFARVAFLARGGFVRQL